MVSLGFIPPSKEDRWGPHDFSEARVGTRFKPNCYGSSLIGRGAWTPQLRIYRPVRAGALGGDLNGPIRVNSPPKDDRRSPHNFSEAHVGNRWNLTAMGPRLTTVDPTIVNIQIC